jgi:putative transcriptional regulator
LGVVSDIAPGFLLASPALLDPNFSRTVVLMCAHEEGGSLGLVVNRPTELLLTDALEKLELSGPHMPRQPVLLGGPVMPERAFVLYDPEGRGPTDDDDLAIGPTLFLSSSLAVLSRIAEGDGPRRFHLLLGHAGWGPGQLPGEIQTGSWIPSDLDEDTLFDVPYESRWDHEMKRLGINPGMVGGNASQA